jgi:hypothetical protein
MTTKPRIKKKYYTVAEANAALPLLRSILRDITELAASLRDRDHRLTRLQTAGNVDRAHQEEIQHFTAEFESDQQRMKDYEQELRNLQVELKDYFTGLIDFPCWMDDREVFLCWRLGEPEVSHWHELDAGFAGRQKLPRINS